MNYHDQIQSTVKALVRCGYTCTMARRKRKSGRRPPRCIAMDTKLLHGLQFRTKTSWVRSITIRAILNHFVNPRFGSQRVTFTNQIA